MKTCLGGEIELATHLTGVVVAGNTSGDLEFASAFTRSVVFPCNRRTSIRPALAQIPSVDSLVLFYVRIRLISENVYFVHQTASHDAKGLGS